MLWSPLQCNTLEEEHHIKDSKWKRYQHEWHILIARHTHTNNYIFPDFTLDGAHFPFDRKSKLASPWASSIPSFRTISIG